jgi:hypothetical protein
MEQLEQIWKEGAVFEDGLTGEDKSAVMALRVARLIVRLPTDRGRFCYRLTNSGQEVMIAWSRMPEDLPEDNGGK